jgi:hypothetical protein
MAIGEAVRYSAERKQFGQPIASFGAIKHKLGEMIVRTYAVESLLYRTAGMIDARISQAARVSADPSAALDTLEEYAIEASIAKVAGSEVLNDVLDENIQVHGGNGYVQDYPAERHYRDSPARAASGACRTTPRDSLRSSTTRRSASGSRACGFARSARTSGWRSRGASRSLRRSSRLPLGSGATSPVDAPPGGRSCCCS